MLRRASSTAVRKSHLHLRAAAPPRCAPASSRRIVRNKCPSHRVGGPHRAPPASQDRSLHRTRRHWLGGKSASVRANTNLMSPRHRPPRRWREAEERRRRRLRALPIRAGRVELPPSDERLLRHARSRIPGRGSGRRSASRRGRAAAARRYRTPSLHPHRRSAPTCRGSRRATASIGRLPRRPACPQ